MREGPASATAFGLRALQRRFSPTAMPDMKSSFCSTLSRRICFPVQQQLQAPILIRRKLRQVDAAGVIGLERSGDVGPLAAARVEPVQLIRAVVLRAANHAAIRT